VVKYELTKKRSQGGSFSKTEAFGQEKGHNDLRQWQKTQKTESMTKNGHQRFWASGLALA